MPTLAINGGRPLRTKPFARYLPIGAEERAAVNRVLESGTLSGFYGSYHPAFRGGPEIQAMEADWASFFGARHAVAVNSATSGLIAAVGAARICPGDEVIVTPVSMAATATAIIVWGGIPVFADIEPDYFCLDPESVERAITPRTRAIMVTDIFGMPYDADAINAIARKHGLLVIEDNAQGPNARLNGRYAGTLGDIGVFSLNYHKHIHTGEGGVVCTDSDELADRLRMIRNHAEAVAGGRVENEPDLDLTNMVGFNFRLGEMEAAIASEQVKKLAGLVEAGVANVRYLESKLAEIPALTMPRLRPGSTHSYYLHAIRYDSEKAGVSRDRFVKAVAAELPPTHGRESDGPLIFSGYGRPLYLLPMYQRRIAFGQRGYPFDSPYNESLTSYREGICPVAERLATEWIVHELFRPPATKSDLDDVAAAFWKVWEHHEELRA